MFAELPQIDDDDPDSFVSLGEIGRRFFLALAIGVDPTREPEAAANENNEARAGE